jgi:hypothetical protein
VSRVNIEPSLPKNVNIDMDKKTNSESWYTG